MSLFKNPESDLELPKKIIENLKQRVNGKEIRDIVKVFILPNARSQHQPTRATYYHTISCFLRTLETNGLEHFLHMDFFQIDEAIDTVDKVNEFLLCCEKVGVDVYIEKWILLLCSLFSELLSVDSFLLTFGKEEEWKEEERPVLKTVMKVLKYCLGEEGNFFIFFSKIFFSEFSFLNLLRIFF